MSPSAHSNFTSRFPNIVPLTLSSFFSLSSNLNEKKITFSAY